MLLPVALNIESKPCLLVGGGAVARRKAQALLECGAQVTVIAPTLGADFVAPVQHIARPYQPGDGVGYHLIFACTDDAATNAAVAREAQERGSFCNVADDSAPSDFHTAATVRRGDICVGITTTGHSPALARHLKREVEACLGPEYERLLSIMGERRAALKRKVTRQAERARLWAVVLAGPALSLLREGRETEAEAVVDEVIDSYVIPNE